jgi:thiol-disulfide isomerase/thioredoxin
MADGPKNGGKTKSLLPLAIGGIVLIGVAAFLYVILSATDKPEPAEGLLAYRQGELNMLQIPGELEAVDPRLPEGAYEPMIWPAAAPAPEMTVTGPDGEPAKISDFKGQVVVVNMWATWCAPCKVEMPTLAALQGAYQTQPLKVMAISADVEEDYEEARQQIAAVPPLEFYHTPGLNFVYEFEPAASSFPTTIIYDKQGVERARLIGDADWNSDEARALIEALLAEG